MSKETIYEIRVKGILDTRWSVVFAPLVLASHQDETFITGAIHDQPELFGILLKIRDMGLQLISVTSKILQPMPPFPVLTTERLLLREFDLADVPAVFDILRREDVNKWLETDPLQSIAETEARVQARMGLFKDKVGFRWAIVLRDDPAQVIGSCGYFSVRRGTQTVETGYEIHPDCWNKGFMTEALRAMIEFSVGAHNLLPVHRMEALVAPGNAASIRILEKLGFDREGLRREFGFWKGRYQDVYLYAMLNRKS